MSAFDVLAFFGVLLGLATVIAVFGGRGGGGGALHPPQGTGLARGWRWWVGLTVFWYGYGMLLVLSWRAEQG